MRRHFGWFFAAGALLMAGCTDGGQFLPTQIVFTSDRDGTERVYIMKANGDDVRLISGAGQARYASMSAAGTKIAYAKFDGVAWRIYLNNHEGTNEQLRFNGVSRDDQHSPMYNRVGSRLVFVAGTGDSQEIFRIDSGGGDLRQLTSTDFASFQPNWSGNKVVFVTNRTGNNEIFIMSGDGTDLVQLTNDPADDIMPAARPTGGTVIFSSNRTGTYQLYTMKEDGTDVVQVTNSAGNKFGASYSTNGNKIFFFGDATGNMEIYSIDLDGSAETNLTNHAATDTKVGTLVAP